MRKTIDGWFAALPTLFPAGDASLRDGRIVYRLSVEDGGIWNVRLVGGKVTVGRHRRQDATAYALDSAGERMGHVDVAQEGGVVDIALSADAFWYEVVLAR